MGKATANKLTRELTRDSSEVSREAKILLKYSTTCGTYLGRLKKLYPERFDCTHTNAGKHLDDSSTRARGRPLNNPGSFE